MLGQKPEPAIARCARAWTTRAYACLTVLFSASARSISSFSWGSFSVVHQAASEGASGDSTRTPVAGNSCQESGVTGCGGR